MTFALSFVLVALNGFRGLWYIYIFRFLILFSSIIPIRYVFSLESLFLYGLLVRLLMWGLATVCE